MAVLIIGLLVTNLLVSQAASPSRLLEAAASSTTNQAASGVITGCMGTSNTTSSLKLGGRTISPTNILQIAPGGSCSQNETALSWNVHGPSGASGVYGDGSASQLGGGPGTNLDLNLSSNYNTQFTSISITTGGTLLVPSGTILRATGLLAVLSSYRLLLPLTEQVAHIPGYRWPPPEILAWDWA